MYRHHEEAIEVLLREYRKKPGVEAIFLGGSVARDQARADSDIDAMILLTDEEYRRREQAGVLTECIFDLCPYEGGYYDIKYCSLDYLTAVAEHGSEPARHAFEGVRCLYTQNPAFAELAKRIPVFQKGEQEDKLLSFFSAYTLAREYFWDMAQKDACTFTKIRTATDLVFFGLRLFLEEHEVLFPCQRRLFQAVAALPEGKRLTDTAEAFLNGMTEEAKAVFERTLQELSHYVPPEDRSVVGTRFVADNELWWYKARPVIAEW